MHILIIGGTSFMGPYIIRNLHTAGHKVSIFHRGQSRIELPEGVQEILGDRDKLPEYASELRKLASDVVLDMVVSHEQHARDLMAMFVGTTRRVVVVSSQDVYQAFGRIRRTESGEIDLSPLTEDSPLREHLYPYRSEKPRAEDDPERWMDEYDKIPAEHEVMSHPDLPGTILRLPAVYGPHDFQHRLFPFLKPMLDERPAILLEESVAAWRWTHGYVENIADAIALAVTSEQASRRIYVVGEPFALSMAERAQQVAKVVGWHGRIVTVPSERLPESMRPKGNVAQHIVVDSSRIRRELGYSERVDLAEAFQRTIAWERDNPPEKIDPSMFDYEAEDKVLAKL